MSEVTGIEWCDSTFNPWIGCTKVGPGCDNCYAEQLMDNRFSRVKWGAGYPRVRTSESLWKMPLNWNAKAGDFRMCGYCGWRGDVVIRHDTPYPYHCPKCTGVDWKPARRRVFCASLADVFDNEVPDYWRADLFNLIVDTPNLDWLLLTKRIGNVVSALNTMGEDRPPDNVWLGATVVNQEEAERDIPKLLNTTARVKFLSIEPMLEQMDIREYLPGVDWFNSEDPMRWWLDWVIVGGESGANARPMHPDWARSLRDQCADAGVPFLFKQWGEWLPLDGPCVGQGFGVGPIPKGENYWLDIDGTLHARNKVSDFTRSVYRNYVVRRVGKKAAGRLLGGRTHDEYPGDCDL